MSEDPSAALAPAAAAPGTSATGSGKLVGAYAAKSAVANAASICRWELLILRVAWLAKSPYEWGEHVKISQRYGVTKEEIARVQQGSVAPGWSEHDAAILRGVEELLGDQCISDATWAELAQSWDEAQLIEFPMMVGQYIATALVQNALRVRLSDGRKGLRER